MPWTRPSEVPVGQIWLRFKGKERDGKPAKMYQIRDMEEKHRKECLDFMQETFLRDEPLSEFLDILSDPVSISSIRANWEGFVSQGVSLACYTEVDGRQGELVGFNNLIVKTRYDEDEGFETVKGDRWRQLAMTLTETDNLVNVFDHYGVDVVLADSGLSVSEEHRGQSIGARMFEAREPLCRALNIPAISTVFTAYNSMVLAKRCGYELLGTLTLSQMKKYGINWDGCSTEYTELRGKKVSMQNTL